MKNQNKQENSVQIKKLKIFKIQIKIRTFTQDMTRQKIRNLTFTKDTIKKKITSINTFIHNM